MKRQYKSFNGQSVKKKTKKTHNVVNLAFFNNEDIAFNSNSTSIDDNTSINSPEDSDEDINDFTPALQEAIFNKIL